MKDSVDLDIAELLTGFQTHVFDRTAGRVDLTALEIFRVRNSCGDRQYVFGAGAPCDDRCDIFAAQGDDLVEMRTFVGVERFPPVQRRFPLSALRAHAGDL